MCTGKPPFRADGAMAVLNRICHERHRPVDQVNPQVPWDLAELIDRLLEKDPSSRPARAEAVVQTLATMLQDPRSRTRYRRQAATRHRARMAWVCSIALVILLAIGVQFWPGWNRTDNTGPSDARRTSAVEGAGSEEAISPDAAATESPSDPMHDSAAQVVRALDAMSDADFEIQLRDIEASVVDQELSALATPPPAGEPPPDAWQLELNTLRAYLQAMEADVDEIQALEPDVSVDDPVCVAPESKVTVDN